MSTVASTLLDFILDLFRDPAKAAAYRADPQGALDAAGLSDTTPEQVADLVPMVSDFATVSGWAGRDEQEDAGGRGRDCDTDEAARPQPRPAEDEDGDRAEVEPVGQDEEDEDGPSGGGGGSSAPAPAGGTETVVITHLQEVHHSHTETTVEIDASHSIWVSGDAQAIFGDVEGDVTQVDNEGGIVAGDDVEDSLVDRSDNSVRDSGNTDVDVRDNTVVVTEGDGNTVVTDSEDVGNTDVDVDDSPINVGSGNQAVDSFNEDNDGLDVERAEDSFNGNGSGNEDNDVIADRGGQVGDDTTVRVDDVNLNTGGGTLVSESSGSGNTTETDVDVHVEDVDVVDAGGDAIVDSEVSDSQNEDNDGTDDSVVGSFNGSDLSDDDIVVVVKDNEVAIAGGDANTGEQEDAQNDDSYNEFEAELETTYEVTTGDDSAVDAG